MSRDFNNAYSEMGRESIPPETLVKALLLRAMFSIPSEIRLCEAIEFNLPGAMAIALDGHDGASRIADLSNNRGHAKP